MSTYDFFSSCLKTAQEKYDMLLETPRARAGNLVEEVKEIQRMIKTARDYGEISVEEATVLANEFNKLKFDELAQNRAALKEREKYNVRFRVNR